MIITLCGSTRFERGFHFWNKKLTMDGHTVFSLTAFPSIEGEREWYDAETKVNLDTAHFRKILASDAILVINEWEGSETYTGYSTKNEVDFAVLHGKTVYWSSLTCGFPTCPGRLTQRPPCSVCLVSLGPA